MPKACKRHVPEYEKTLNMKCERQESENEEGYKESQDEIEDEPKKREANHEDDNENDKKEDYVSRDKHEE